MVKNEKANRRFRAPWGLLRNLLNLTHSSFMFIDARGKLTFISDSQLQIPFVIQYSLTLVWTLVSSSAANWLLLLYFTLHLHRIFCFQSTVRNTWADKE